MRYHVSTGNKTHSLQEQPGFLPAEPSLSSPKDMPLPLPKEQIIILLPGIGSQKLTLCFTEGSANIFVKDK